jgi:hypothetical protein
LGLHWGGTGAGLLDFFGGAFGAGAAVGGAEQSFFLLSITAFMIEAFEVWIMDLACFASRIWARAVLVESAIFFFSASILDFRRVIAEASCAMLESWSSLVTELLLKKLLELEPELELELLELELDIDIELELELLELELDIDIELDEVTLEICWAILVAEFTMEDYICEIRDFDALILRFSSRMLVLASDIFWVDDAICDTDVETIVLEAEVIELVRLLIRDDAVLVILELEDEPELKLELELDDELKLELSDDTELAIELIVLDI